MATHDEFPAPVGFDDEEIPVIDDRMMHEQVDFEARMSPWPVVSLALMAACAFAFGFQVSNGSLEDRGKILHAGALERDLVTGQGEAWRMVSAMFLHGGLDHLIGNLLMLYILGMACEHGFGRPQFLALYVAAGLCGSLLSLVGGRPSVGASGAIFGLAGALIVLFWRYRGRLHVRDQRVGIVLAVWAAYQLALGFLNPAVDNLAHLGGLLGGALMGLVLSPAVLEGRAEVAARPTTWVGAALAAAALGAAAVFFVPRLLGAA
jgi:rhomboid protease GluP